MTSMIVEVIDDLCSDLWHWKALVQNQSSFYKKRIVVWIIETILLLQYSTFNLNFSLFQDYFYKDIHFICAIVFTSFMKISSAEKSIDLSLHIC